MELRADEKVIQRETGLFQISGTVGLLSEGGNKRPLEGGGREGQGLCWVETENSPSWIAQWIER